MKFSTLSNSMKWHHLFLVFLLSLAMRPAPCRAALPYPTDLLPQEASVAAYDAAITADASAGLTPTARLTTPASGRVPFHFGQVSGDATMEFIVEGNPAANTGGYLAVGSNVTSNLRYEQWNNTGQLGFTQLGLIDYLFSPGIPSPTSPTLIAYVWQASASTMSLYVNGRLAGTRSGVTPAFAMPTDQGWLGGNPAGGELMVGTIHRVTVYNERVSPEILQRHAHAFNGLGTRLDAGGGAVAIDGDLAAVASYPGTAIFRMQNGSWQHWGDLDPWASSLALEGDTLLVGAASSVASDPGRALVYARSDEPGLNAWNLTDRDSGGPSANYGFDVPVELDAAARTNGWRYTLHNRLLNRYDASPAMAFLYGDGTNRFGMFLYLNSAGHLVAGLLGVSPERVLTTDPIAASAYHRHELVFDPTNQMATYYFDGSPIHTWAGHNQVNNGIFWGSGSTMGQGDMNVHQVRFEIFQSGSALASYDAGTHGNPWVAPDPVTQGWYLANTNRPFYSTVDPRSPDLETVWRRQAELRASDGAADDGFGAAVDLSGKTAVIGAPYDDDGGTDTGSAYVFARSEDNWTQQKKLAPSVRAALDTFGLSVAVDGDSVIVGAPNRYFGTQTSPGRAFVFIRTGADWTQQAQLLASDGAARESFGYAVDIEGDRVVAGAAYDTHSGRTFAGSAYVFERSGASWTQRARLIASPVVGGSFGSALALRGDAVVVGAEFADRHYLFTRNSAGAWVQRQSRDYQGSRVQDVDFDGMRFIVSVGMVEDQGENAAYIYAPDYSNTAGVADLAAQLLYYPAAAASGLVDPHQAAFRYKHLLYGLSNGVVRARFENMASLYGENERRRASETEEVLLRGLSLNPDDAGLGHLLLDLCYDRTVAETILTKDLVAAAEVARFGDPLAPPALPGGFLIDNEIALYRQVEATNRFALQCYFDLLQKELLVQQTRPPAARWAARVLDFSSQFSTASWSAAQALGQPDTYPLHGDITTAWAGATSDDQREFLELGYDNSMPIHSVSIYETYNPGAVDKVSVRDADTGLWQEVWSGVAAPAGNSARVITVTFPLTAFPVDAVHIDLDSPAVPGWNEIDAVGILTPATLTTTPEPGFGHRIFQTLVPERGLMPATYTNASGMATLVTTNTAALTNGMLFTGYKDLVLLFDLLREHGRAAETLGRLLLSRNGPGDLAEAAMLAGDAHRFLVLQGNLLKGIFATLPPEEDPSGLAQSLAGWSAAIESLVNLSQAVAGNENPLGFAPDFLMLVENFFGVQSHFDSFDSFAERLDIGRGSSVLLAAQNALADARLAYGNYRGFEDELAEQYDQSTVSFEFRLFEIVGAFPGEDNYSENPTHNSGSELDQQSRSIDLARLRIQKNQVDIDNLNKEVQIERARAAAVQEITIRYGNQQASLTEEIGRINAAQAAANQLTDYFNPANLVSGASIAIAVNFGVQTIAELEKGELEAQKERLGALEQSEIVGAESDARVKTLLLRMNTLLLDSKEAGLLLQQEWARITALFREKRALEARLAEREASLASRYFADPVHRLASQSAMVDANLDFDEARSWMFFMTRAFEYKWNESFTNSFRGRLWNADSVFKVRNADELVDLYDALVDRNDKINRGRQPETSWFSLREDHFGYKEGTDAQGQPLRYLDSDTGELVPAIEAFRRQLLRNTRQVANGEEIVIEFSTVREIPGENFFLPATFDTNGVTIPGQRGSYLDKIDGLHIRLPGAHTLGRTTVPGTLTYGGTSFIRKPRVGTFDPARPDRLRDELTAYSTRYWFQDFDLVWRFIDSFSSPVTTTLSTGPRMETTAEEIVVFKERSVATTGWVLSLRTRTGVTQLLKIDELTDIELLFRHSAISRLQ